MTFLLTSCIALARGSPYTRDVNKVHIDRSFELCKCQINKVYCNLVAGIIRWKWIWSRLPKQSLLFQLPCCYVLLHRCVHTHAHVPCALWLSVVVSSVVLINTPHSSKIRTNGNKIFYRMILSNNLMFT